MQLFLQDDASGARSARWAVFFRRVLFCLAAFFAACGAWADALVNGGFDSGLSGWQTKDGVFSSSGVAVLADDGFTSGLLWQPVASLEGRFTLSFDFNNALSASVPQGT